MTGMRCPLYQSLQAVSTPEFLAAKNLYGNLLNHMPQENTCISFKILLGPSISWVLTFLVNAWECNTFNNSFTVKDSWSSHENLHYMILFLNWKQSVFLLIYVRSTMKNNTVQSVLYTGYYAAVKFKIFKSICLLGKKVNELISKKTQIV